MGIQAVVAVPAKVAATTAKVASQVVGTVAKASAQVARGAAQAGSTTFRSTAQAGSTATRSTAHAGSGMGRGAMRAPSPNGVVSQGARQADVFRAADSGKSGEARMSSRADRYEQARSSSKGPKSRDSMMEELMKLASGQQESERGR